MNVNGYWLKCHTCNSDMWLPDALYEAAKKAREDIMFYCPYGHAAVFTKGESEADKLRRERDLLAQQVAERDDRIRRERESREAAERQLRAQRGVVTRIKNRVGHGVCPCCSRTFDNLGRHMKSKHPAYAQSDVVLEAAE